LFLASQDLQVNMLFSGGPFPGQTFVTAVGVTTGSDKLTVKECGYSCITATVEGYGGGKALATGKLHSLPASGTTVRVTSGPNSTVEVETPVYRLLFSSPIQDTAWRNGVEDTAHVDLASELLGKPTDPSGILGDTAAFLAEGRAANPDWKMRAGGDYVVDSLFATSCATCTYTAAAVRAVVGSLRDASARLGMAAVRRAGRRVPLAVAGLSH